MYCFCTFDTNIQTLSVLTYYKIKNRRNLTVKIVFSESGQFQFPFHFPVISNFSQFSDEISTDMDLWHFACCWHKIFSILVIKQFSYHCVDIMDIIYYFCSCDGFVHNEALKDKQKGKKYAKYQTAIEIFRNWKLFPKLTNSRQSRKGWGWRKEKHYFHFYFSNLFACLKCLPVAFLTLQSDHFLFHCSLFYQNVKHWL